MSFPLDLADRFLVIDRGHIVLEEVRATSTRTKLSPFLPYESQSTKGDMRHGDNLSRNDESSNTSGLLTRRVFDQSHASATSAH